ncbi:MAG: helix-turn-helix domain-containing protein [Bacteroidota bacterium]
MDRSQILNHVLALANKKGWEKTSVRDISAAIGYSTIKVYSDFGGKEKLLQEIQERGFKQLQEHYLNALRRDTTHEEKLFEMACSHAIFSFTNPTLYDLMFSLNEANCKPGTLSIKRKTGNLIKEVLDELTKDDASQVFLQFFAWIHGFSIICREIPNVNEGELKKMVKAQVKNFIYGIK